MTEPTGTPTPSRRRSWQMKPVQWPKKPDGKFVTHVDALTAACPVCGAAAGDNCYGKRTLRNGQPFQRTRHHFDRYLAFVNLLTAEPSSEPVLRRMDSLSD